MKTLLFVTSNPNKVKEIKEILPPGYSLQTPADLGIFDDIEESGDTIEANSLLKSEYIFSKTNRDCFSEDTGLEVDSLNGAPGVYSARYAGPGAIACDNIRKLLDELGDNENRSARFKTVITYIEGGKSIQFEGVLNGVISKEPLGDKGFGYDPVFIPEGFKQTLAELSSGQKSAISHRSKAFVKFMSYLNTTGGKR